MAERQRFQLPKENKVLAVAPEKIAAFVQGTLREGDRSRVTLGRPGPKSQADEWYQPKIE